MQKFLVAALLMTALAGCLSGTGDSDDDAVVPDHEHAAVPAVDAAALVADMRAFAQANPLRSDNSGDHEGARTWLMEKFASYGLETYRQDYDNGIPQANILGIKWGNVRDHWVVVGGHYDVVPCARSPGAPSPVPPGTVPRQSLCNSIGPAQTEGMYDDASGTMLTVHLAKSFAKVNTTYTYVFVAFDGEERGLQGSEAFVEHFAFGNSSFGEVTIHAMLDLDMFGLNWPSVDAPIYFDSNTPELDGAVRDLAADIGMPESEVKYQGIRLGRSDYAHFFTLGVPTGFFISSFEEYQAPANIPVAAQNPAVNAYPFWHRADTWETMMLMAGSEADVIAGFQTAADLALGVLCFMGDPATVYTVEIE